MVSRLRSCFHFGAETSTSAGTSSRGDRQPGLCGRAARGRTGVTQVPRGHCASGNLVDVSPAPGQPRNASDFSSFVKPTHGPKLSRRDVTFRATLACRSATKRLVPRFVTQRPSSCWGAARGPPCFVTITSQRLVMTRYVSINLMSREAWSSQTVTKGHGAVEGGATAAPSHGPRSGRPRMGTAVPARHSRARDTRGTCTSLRRQSWGVPGVSEGVRVCACTLC